MSNQSESTTFKSGAIWVRADFHLHTLKERGASRKAYRAEWKDREDEHPKAWIQKLKKEGIKVAVITNHNHFDKGEFKCLAKRGAKEGILILPGVELGINEGNNVHTLFIFDPDTWVNNQEQEDYISNFINSQFPSSQYDEGKTSKDGLKDCLEALEEFKKDYFVIFAHIENDNGIRSELNNRSLEQLAERCGKLWDKRILGLQRVPRIDAIESHWPGNKPAFVEGSDPKAFSEVGQCAHQCYIKIGALCYSSVKFSLSDPRSRVSHNKPSAKKHSYIESIEFTGGTLDGNNITFSPEFNSLIGIRGSGKSSILEALRYGLNITLADEVLDKTYKQGLVKNTLGSGGFITIHARDRHQQPFSVRRVLGEASEVFSNGQLIPGVSIGETVLHRPIYFGQKDLSSIGDGFETELIDKIIGSRVQEKRREIEAQAERVKEAILNLEKLKNIDAEIEEQKQKLQDADFRLRIYREQGVAEKLAKQAHFTKDLEKIKASMSTLKSFGNSIKSTLNEYEDDLKNHPHYDSKENAIFFEGYFSKYAKVLDKVEDINSNLKQLSGFFKDLSNSKDDFEELQKEAKEEFSETRRLLEEKLRTEGNTTLNLDEFPSLSKTVDTATKLIAALEKTKTRRLSLKETLTKELSQLNKLWNEEFQIIKSELDKINDSQVALQIIPNFKGDRESLLNYVLGLFRGSRINKTTFQRLLDESEDGYKDFVDLYKDLNNAKKLMGSSPETFEKYFGEHLSALLTYQTPNKITINYKGKQLQHHSLGQRASALILFVLSQKEHDVVIIDQPEDDLDNQTIYKDVILLLRELKPSTQFIFATHNANFPVLGDAEQIHCCRYVDNSIEVETGSIDSPSIQQKVIDIMEGGKDAFNKRKHIYDLWK